MQRNQVVAPPDRLGAENPPAREVGLDLFRILCCLGVLGYHTLDDIVPLTAPSILVPCRALYYLCSFCVPGFFLLSGFLLGRRREVTAVYCEKKIFSTLARLTGWVVLWCFVRFVRTGESLNPLEQVWLGARQGGILPVIWFLFTYCLLLIVASPLRRLLERFPRASGVGALLLLALPALGFGDGWMSRQPQFLWLHLYLTVFLAGMWLGTQKPYRHTWKSRAVLAALSLAALAAYLIFVQQTGLRYPHRYYGKWPYTVWLLSMFLLCQSLPAPSRRMCELLARLSKDTLAAYLWHMPVLTWTVTRLPIVNTWMALAACVLLFAGGSLTAAVLRRLPALRRLV